MIGCSHLLTATFTLLYLGSNIVYTQSLIEYETPAAGKTHLSGIRPLPSTTMLSSRVVEPILSSERSNPPRARAVPTVNSNTVSSANLKNQLLKVVKEALTDFDASSEGQTPIEEHYELPEVVTPQLPSERIIESPRKPSERIIKSDIPVQVNPSSYISESVNTAAGSPDINEDQEEGIENDSIRRSRLQARWRRLGPMVKSLSYRLKPKPGEPESSLNPYITPENVSRTLRKIVRARLRQISARFHNSGHHKNNKNHRESPKEVPNPNEEESLGKNKIYRHPSRISIQTVQNPNKQGGITARPFVNGPILAEFGPENNEDGTSGLANFVPMRAAQRNAVHSDRSSLAQHLRSFPIDKDLNPMTPVLPPQTPAPAPTQTPTPPQTPTPSPLTPPTESPESERLDYHFRTPPPIAKYKFAQKLRQRPRLRIRRPGEAPMVRGNRTASRIRPLELPLLTPFGSGGEPRFSSKTHIDHDKVGKFGGDSKALPFGGDEFTEMGKTPDSGGGSFGGGGGSFGGGGGSFGGGGGSFGGGSGGSGMAPGAPPVEFGSGSFGLSGGGVQVSTEIPQASLETTTESSITTDFQPQTTETTQEPTTTVTTTTKAPPPPEPLIIPENSGLRSVAPPPEFGGGFGSAHGGSSPFGAPSGSFGGGGGGFGSPPGGFGSPPSDGGSGSHSGGGLSGPPEPGTGESMFTGESALTTNHRGPTGDGYGPPLIPGAAVPPPVPAISLGGNAAGISPFDDNELPNPPTTVRPSALLSMLSKADLGFNQAINHFEQGTPLESAAIDILEVALGSQKLDSQAKLLGHVDRTIGIDNLQRIQRWANTGGALDALKEQFVKIAKNYSPPENLLPTIPPQLDYLFSSHGKKR